METRVDKRRVYPDNSGIEIRRRLTGEKGKSLSPVVCVYAR